MTLAALKAKLDRMVWILIYAGMFAIVLGIASRPTAPVAGWIMIVVGGLACVAGVVLIWMRSRLDEPG